MRPGSSQPRFVLYENSETINRHGEDVITPTESIGVPEHYTDANTYTHLRKFGRESASGLASPNRFLQSDRADNAYPDYPEEDRRCAFLRQPTTMILIGAFAGVLFGILLSSLKVSSDVTAIVSLPGSIFLQVLKCFVMPMIFTSLTTGVAEIVVIGKVSVIGTKTALYFIGLSTVAAILSMGIAMMFRNLHPDTVTSQVESSTAFLKVKCADGKFWAADSKTGAVSCTSATNTAPSSSVTLQMVDLTGVILADATESAATSITTQITSILYELLPINIFASFQDGTLLSVISFSLIFGAAAVKVSSREHSPLLAVLNQMNKVFFIVIKNLIDWSPLAVVSLVAGSLSSQSQLASSITHVGIMILGYLLSVLIFELVFLPFVIWLAIRKNPFPYMRAMLPAAMFAFGCASSIATLPVTLRCVETTHEVSRGLLHFVVTIGCSAHKNGAAMYFPAAVVFLVTTSEEQLSLGWWQLSLIVFISLLGSLGTAPITNSSLVVIYSVWQTVYPSAPMPASFSYLVAIDWLLDRFSTVCNVVGDTYVARIIAEGVDETYDVPH